MAEYIQASAYLKRGISRLFDDDVGSAMSDLSQALSIAGSGDDIDVSDKEKAAINLDIARAVGFSTCAECSSIIILTPGANRSDRAYCSNACRQRAYRNRKET